MKFIALSDTHGQHADITLPDGDVLLHAGDLSRRGTENQVKDFLHWFGAQKHRHKIFIAGNHDFLFETAAAERVAALIPDGVVYLNDSGIEIEGIKIWGSPVQPWFHDWAFNRQRGADIKKHWDLIPQGTDILLTHGPAEGILDRTVYGKEVGCADLLDAVRRVNPSFFVCGHIHEAHGQEVSGRTTFINASVLDEDYSLVNPPIEFHFRK